MLKGMQTDGACVTHVFAASKLLPGGFANPPLPVNMMLGKQTC